MPIQTIIKTKRKELALTQEQVADYLGVSTPAVSKWESGVSYPDIALLPPLARLLKIDLNTLLCFQEELTKQEIQKFSSEVMDKIKKDGFESGLSLAFHKIEEYPNSTQLIHDMAMLLDGAMFMTGMSSADREKYEDQIDALYERAAGSNDDEISHGATFMLASKYIKNDKFTKAQEMLDSLPSKSALDKRLLQAVLLDKQGKPEEAAQIHERILIMSVTEVWNHLLSLIELELKMNNHDQAANLADICSKSAELFGLSDYYKIIPRFQLALTKQNEEESLVLMEALFASATKPWSFSDSPLFKRFIHKNEAAAHTESDQSSSAQSSTLSILPALISELESNPQYKFLHKSPRYQLLVDQYKPVNKQ